MTIRRGHVTSGIGSFEEAAAAAKGGLVLVFQSFVYTELVLTAGKLSRVGVVSSW